MATSVLIVIDAVGISTLDYLFDRFTGIVHLPNLAQLGLGTLLADRHRHRFGPRGDSNYAVSLNQASATADSVIGHREMVGVIDDRIYNLFPDGFPAEYIAALESRIGRSIMFNRMGGGVEVIEANALEHKATGRPIVYASKCDPLIQIAMNESVIPVVEQHRIADIALAVALEMGIPITRAISRAFIVLGCEYVRTANRHDAVLALPQGTRTIVDILRDRGVWTVSVGKPSDSVFSQFNQEIHLANPHDIDGRLGLRFAHPKMKDTNPYTVQGVLNALHRARSIHQAKEDTFIFANLVDTDALYGHTRDVAGALASLQETDRILPLVRGALRPGDLLIVTADHGMEHRDDYGYHHREPLPLLVERIGSADLGLATGRGEGLTEVGNLVAQMFGCADEFLHNIIRIQA